jgi:hypothetical protein
MRFRISEGLAACADAITELSKPLLFPKANLLKHKQFGSLLAR